MLQGRESVRGLLNQESFYVADHCPTSCSRFINARLSSLRTGSRSQCTIDDFASQRSEVFEKRIVALEGDKFAIAVSSEAAAVLMTVQALAKPRGNIVFSRSLYNGTISQFDGLLPHYGIQTRYFGNESHENDRSLIDERKNFVLCGSVIESPALRYRLRRYCKDFN